MKKLAYYTLLVAGLATFGKVNYNTCAEFGHAKNGDEVDEEELAVQFGISVLLGVMLVALVVKKPR